MPGIIGSPLGIGDFGWILPLALLDIVLKGLALWRSAKNNQPYWFIALLLLNTLGILPLIYLIVVDKNVVWNDIRKRLR